MKYDRIQLLAVLAAMALAGPSVQAQNALGDGRALDNNLQAGSGGVNAPQTTTDYRARNDLITGDVAGSGYFRGNVGYGSPGAFRGRLGSEDLFRFRAQSYLATPSARPWASASPLASPTSVYQGGSALGVGAVNRSYATDAALQGLSFQPGTAGLRVGAAGGSGAGLMPVNTLGVMAQPDGQLLSVTATPLLGLRYRPMSGQRTATPAASAGQGVPIAPGSVQWTAEQAVDPALRGEMNGGSMLGQQIQARVEAHRAEDDWTMLDQQIAQLESAMFSPLQSRGQDAGQDVYMQILARVKQGRDAVAGAAAPAPGSPPPNQTGLPPVPPATPAPSGSTATPGPGTSSAGVDAGVNTSLAAAMRAALAPPTDEQLRASELARARATAQREGLIGPDGKPAVSLDPLQRAAEERAAQEKALKGTPLEHLMQALDYQAPAVASLATTTDDQVNRDLRLGEEYIAAGRYFDAEGRYGAVLTAVPGHVMAQVGMIHAQLGAGMVRSATLGLRRLFDAHPELIATRYAPNLLPPPQRLKWVRAELERTMPLARRPEPAIMLAYLGYQARSLHLVVLGLNYAEATAPDDAMVRVLRRIWLGPTPGPTQDVSHLDAQGRAPQPDGKPPAGGTEKPQP